SAALGPVLGGFLVAAAGWQAVFLVNVPATLAGLALAFAWLPADGPGPELAVERGGRAAAVRGSIRRMDLPGVALFSGTLAALLAFLLSLPDGRRWWLLAVAIASGALLASRSLRAPEPFLDLRMLASNRALVGVYAQFAAINVVFYAVFFGLPLWLQEARGFHPAQAGLLLLPVAGVGVLATPVAAVLTRRGGPRPSMLIGAVGLTAGSLLLLAVGPTTPLMGLVAVSVVLGVPNGFNNLGLQAALYERAPRGLMGTAGGQFQTARYVGAVLSTALLGAAFGRSAGTADLHLIAWVLAGISAALVVAALVTRAGGPRPVEPGASA
ncbi:MAG TPA: MFS transporter, partial [Actinomycetota bacterium]|nr:MFS transporter [Actinomycetota bacterium]